ncbi:MAG: recombination mediator RecR [Bacteroidales bacterium]|nr:recombination mediator RecR [Bacteroidales bacterium]
MSNKKHFPLKQLEILIAELSKFPGIGPKTAFRMTMNIIRRGKNDMLQLSNALINLAESIKICKVCKSLSDDDICLICNDPERDKETICIVEDIEDLLSIERTNVYKGVYHVLGGLINPMEGITPANLYISDLINRLLNEKVKEIIFALSPTPEGDTTAHYIYRQLKNLNIKVTTIARGISMGTEIEYADEYTLSKSIQNRVLFE